MHNMIIFGAQAIRMRRINMHIFLVCKKRKCYN